MGLNLSKLLRESIISMLYCIAEQVSIVSAKLFGNKEMRLLMLGLDAAGKTS